MLFCNIVLNCNVIITNQSKQKRWFEQLSNEFRFGRCDRVLSNTNHLYVGLWCFDASCHESIQFQRCSWSIHDLSILHNRLFVCICLFRLSIFSNFFSNTIGFGTDSSCLVDGLQVRSNLDRNLFSYAVCWEQVFDGGATDECKKKVFVFCECREFFCFVTFRLSLWNCICKFK